ncbi:hypothetical protein [Pengzhenrongella sp.]|jgi:hypothetical protein|uniref:hypothetical protein n=1 Tax=Pengzhenrongella sp. TaxID=2888820 RepID=UPI002F91ED98
MQATFALDPDAPPLTQAASLALALLRAAKIRTWAELVVDPAPLAAVSVTPEQMALLNTHAGALTTLRVGPPMVTLAVCPECSRFTIVSGQAATSCPLTLGCTGKPQRASTAARLKAAPTAKDAPVETVDAAGRARSGDPHIHQS